MPQPHLRLSARIDRDRKPIRSFAQKKRRGRTSFLSFRASEWKQPDRRGISTWFDKGDLMKNGLGWDTRWRSRCRCERDEDAASKLSITSIVTQRDVTSRSNGRHYLSNDLRAPRVRWLSANRFYLYNTRETLSASLRNPCEPLMRSFINSRVVLKQQHSECDKIARGVRHIFFL